MTRVPAFVLAPILGMLAAAPALAQQSDPPLDSLSAPQEGPSELDALGAAQSPEFPDIEEEQQRAPVSVKIRALNKITAKYTDITIAMNETAAFGQLEITPRYCDKRPPEEFPETSAFLEIRDTTAAAVSDLKEPAAKAKKRKSEETSAPAALPADVAADDRKLAFSGWMFASTPALSALEHPVYDVWVIDCKTVIASR